MRWVSLIKKILGFLLVFAVVFSVGNKIVFGVGYTQAQIEANCPGGDCSAIAATNKYSTNMYYASGQMYSGFYQSLTNGLFYPIGGPADPIYNPGGGGGGGSGPAETGGVCTGIYDSCTAYTACSTTCGPGTQTRACFDTGCGAVQVQSQACQVNDPNIWGPPTTCSVKCGTGTQNITNQCGTTVPQACNTSACPAWTKLKDSSFISTNSLFNMISLTPSAYDVDDTTEQFLIVGTSGLAAAPALDIDISNVSPTAKTGSPEYKVIYTPESYSLTPSSFLSYVKARKEYKVITDLSEITGSGIYVYNGNVAISSNVNPFDQPYKIVLIVAGTVTVSSAPDNTFTPAGTAAIVASTINFDSSMTEAQGIFIGNNISTGINAAQGLKIVGNLVAQASFSNSREWTTTSRPSLFIVFDQTKYIDLLSYLSTASYQWNQTQ